MVPRRERALCGPLETGETGLEQTDSSGTDSMANLYISISEKH